MSDTITLPSGKQVELHDLSMQERQTCEDAITHRYATDGSLVLGNIATARNLWCLKAMQVTLEKLADYTTADLNEIAMEVRRRAGQFKDPTEQEG